MNELSLFNPLFDDGFFGVDFPVFKARSSIMPKVDVKETNEAYTLDMDLPGLTEKNVDISLKNNVLTISSVQEKESKNENEKDAQSPSYLIHERSMISFSRSFTLPEDVKAEDVNAAFKNGVLSVTMPRSKKANETKKIAITAA